MRTDATDVLKRRLKQASLPATGRGLRPIAPTPTPAIAFLGLLADLLDGGNRAGTIGRLKPLLLGPKLPTAAGVNYPWNAGLPRPAIARRAPCPPQGASGRDLPCSNA